MKYVCSICGYVYDEEKGSPQQNIPAGTKWEALPENWKCPLCGAAKSDFISQETVSPPAVSLPLSSDNSLQELTPMEMSVLCSNLARGCEKQYKTGESAAFTKLADYFRSKADPTVHPSFPAILEKIQEDLSSGYPLANSVSAEKSDRGALRSLVWSEKVTKMLSSLLSRYETQGEKMLENTGIYVCTICGFVYIGNQLPEICPVCKVTNRKFEKIGGVVNG